MVWGFTVDESLETLGQELKLPPSLETSREAIERVLPSLDPMPATTEGSAS